MEPTSAPLAVPDSGVPDAITPVLGHRLWEVRQDRLWPLWFAWLPWVPQQVSRATCHQPQGPFASALAGRPLPLHSAPDPSCSCGIYAAAAADDLPSTWSGTKEVLVWGVVALWGRVVIAERGWRAQFAHPVSLTYQDLPGSGGKVAVSDGDWRRFHIAQAAHRYRLPVFDTGAEAWAHAPELAWQAPEAR